MKKIAFIILLLFGTVNVHANCATGVVESPIIDLVTYDAAGNITVTWLPINDPDLAYYEIFVIDNTGANVALPGGTVTPPAALSFTFTSALINSGTIVSSNTSISFIIVAYDNCGGAGGPNSSPFSAVHYVNTVLVSADFDRCSSSVTLNWNSYDGFISQNTVRYDISVSTNFFPPVFVGSTFSTTYNHQGIVRGNTYKYFVTAIENGGLGPFRSRSNDTIADISNALLTPKFLYSHFATVIDSQQIDLQFYVDTSALNDVKNYHIERALSENGVFNVVGIVPHIVGMNPQVTYSDEGLLTDSNAYFYRIAIENVCEDFDSSRLSNVSGTIVLKTYSNSIEALNTLTFTNYTGWGLDSVLQYDIYRSVAGVWDPFPIKTLPAFSGTTTYIDDITDVFVGDGIFCYKIVALEKGIPHIGNLPAAKSTSNETCVIHQPLLYMPNAFAPSGIYNKTFKPILSFANPTTYYFKVFNRWGQVVFESRDVNEAWNGRFNNTGNYTAPGTYLYTLKFESSTGKFTERKGALTLVD